MTEHDYVKIDGQTFAVPRNELLAIEFEAYDNLPRITREMLKETGGYALEYSTSAQQKVIQLVEKYHNVRRTYTI